MPDDLVEELLTELDRGFPQARRVRPRRRVPPILGAVSDERMYLDLMIAVRVDELDRTTIAPPVFLDTD